ncbi:hybrid sensor histidine kinase/response regulator [bacterium]|nr:MAG: hybrid sensor histidine kinase/response regulator [bacterium]
MDNESLLLPISNNDFHVLIVDDLDDNRTLLRLDLEDELPGLHVDEAQNGFEALEMLEKNRYTLVLCDLMMPDIDGFEVYNRAKEIEMNSNLPFIFISANQDQNMALKGLEIGAIDFLKKPYDVTELILKSKNLCRLKIYSDRQFSLVDKLNETNLHLKELNTQKDEVLRIVSHDMRNPLGNIIGLAQILQEVPDQEPEEIKTIADVMIRSGENLLAIVNTLLDAARLESGKIELQLSDVNLIKIISEEVEQFSYTAKQKNISIRLESPIREAKATIDEPKIRQSIANLISNALKFTQEHGEVIVSLAQDDFDYIITVRDNGIGIDSTQLPFVFEKFSSYQRSGTKNERGTGLGLSIVKAFITLHNGSITVKSESGKGTLFTVRLPKV